MTPAARIASAIGILDGILAGAPAEQALTAWARTNRYAGSGDRAAIRDHVYDALRRLNSYTALAGAAVPGGRALMIGLLRDRGDNPASVFGAGGYAPDELTAEERDRYNTADLAAPPPEVALDCPEWLIAQLRRDLGEDADRVLSAMRTRAPAFLRVNLRRTEREAAAVSLAADGVETRPHPGADTALEVLSGERRIRASAAYRDGWVELQDLSPQAAVAGLSLSGGDTLLDYCAGGGGKLLAAAGRVACIATAHDANPARMTDLPARAARAGIEVEIAVAADLTGRHFDAVILDVPCSGSGTWRRDPAAKWTLSAARLEELTALQRQILAKGAGFVGPGGRLVYMTCSLLGAENENQIDGFLADAPDWRLVSDRLWTPLSGGDGFYAAELERA